MSEHIELTGKIFVNDEFKSKDYEGFENKYIKAAAHQLLLKLGFVNSVAAVASCYA